LPADLATVALIIPETIPALRALEQLQKAKQRVALVSDEFGVGVKSSLGDDAFGFPSIL
jgi:CBS domain containing-hemolysin-like protein